MDLLFPMKEDVLILCGGLGTRLRSTIGENQKVLAAIDEVPFLQILLKYHEAQGFKRVILCAGYQAQAVSSFISQYDGSLELIISEEKEPLGTGGAVKYARDRVKTDPVFVINGDSFCSVDYQKFLDFHKDKESRFSMVLVNLDDNKDYGSVVLDDDGRIVFYNEKKETPHKWINAGIYCMQRDIFDKMPPEKRFSMEVDCFPALIGDSFFGFKTDADFIDIGTPARYEQAKTLLAHLTQRE